MHIIISGTTVIDHAVDNLEGGNYMAVAFVNAKVVEIENSIFECRRTTLPNDAYSGISIAPDSLVLHIKNVVVKAPAGTNVSAVQLYGINEAAYLTVDTVTVQNLTMDGGTGSLFQSRSFQSGSTQTELNTFISKNTTGMLTKNIYNVGKIITDTLKANVIYSSNNGTVTGLQNTIMVSPTEIDEAGGAKDTLMITVVFNSMSVPGTPVLSNWGSAELAVNNFHWQETEQDNAFQKVYATVSSKTGAANSVVATSNISQLGTWSPYYKAATIQSWTTTYNGTTSFYDNGTLILNMVSTSGFKNWPIVRLLNGHNVKSVSLSRR
jgi:hypothetical protein